MIGFDFSVRIAVPTPMRRSPFWAGYIIPDRWLMLRFMTVPYGIELSPVYGCPSLLDIIRLFRLIGVAVPMSIAALTPSNDITEAQGLF